MDQWSELRQQLNWTISQSQSSRHTIQGLCTLYSLHYRSQTSRNFSELNCSSATATVYVFALESSWTNLSVLLRNAATITHSQFQTQVVASSLTVVVHRLARVASPLAPRSVATGTPGERTPVHQHASLIIARPRQTSHNSLCYRFRNLSTNGHRGPQVLIFSPAVYTACVVLSVDSTRRGSHAAGGDVLQ